MTRSLMTRLLRSVESHGWVKPSSQSSEAGTMRAVQAASGLHPLRSHNWKRIAPIRMGARVGTAAMSKLGRNAHAAGASSPKPPSAPAVPVMRGPVHAMQSLRVSGSWSLVARGMGSMAGRTTARAAAGSSRIDQTQAAGGDDDDNGGIVPAEVQEYWRRVLERIDKSHLKEMRDAMDVRVPLGMTQAWAKSMSGSSVACWDEFLAYKKLYPKDIVQMQNGSFFETVGIDALVLGQWLGLNMMSATKGVPKAGYPQSQERANTKRLRAAGFRTVVLRQVDDDRRLGGRMQRALTGRATPAHAAYVPDGGDDTDEAFITSKPLMGVSAGRMGLTLWVLYLDMKQVVAHDQLTEESLKALMAAIGAAPPLLLHSSVHDGLASSSLRAFLTDYARSNVGDWDTYGDGNPLQGFINKAKLEVFTHLDDISKIEFQVVRSTERRDGRPRCLPQCTVTQLGLQGDVGMSSLMAHVVPGSTPALCRTFLEQLLLMPPPPHIAKHLHAATGHLATTTAAVSTLSTDMPTAKISAAISALSGDARFFRGVHDLLEPLVDMLAMPEHGPLWDALLPVGLHFNNRLDTLEPRELANRLRGVMAAIQNTIALTVPDGMPRRASPSSSSDDESGVPVAGLAFTARQQQTLAASVESARDKSDRALDGYFEQQEDFRWQVRADRMAKELTEVDKTGAVYQETVRAFYAAVMSKAHAPQEKNMPIIRCPDDQQLAVHVPKNASILVRTFAPAAFNVSSARGAQSTCDWATPEMQGAYAAYQGACAKAQKKARALCRELCSQLVGEPLWDLLLACRLSVVKTALELHVLQARKLGWTRPKLVAGEGLDDVHPPRLLPPGVAPPPMRMELNGFWPFWLSADSPDTVRNSLVLDRMMLLTGPNMSGKSTVLRSVGAAALLAMCGLCVPARDATVPFYDCILLRNFSGDSAMEGKSSYGLEMAEVRSAQEQCTPRSLVLLDELCKGTEVQHGTAMAHEVLKRWCHQGVTGIFASHLHDLVPLAEDAQLDTHGLLGFKCMGLVTDAHGNKGTTRLLQDGVCYESLAFEVALAAGVDPDVVDGARRTLARMLRGDIQSRTPLRAVPGRLLRGGATPGTAAAAPLVDDDVPVQEDGDAAAPETSPPEVAPAPDALNGASDGEDAIAAAAAPPPPPQRTIHDAMQALREVVMHMVGGVGEGADGCATQKPEFQVVGEKQQPPPAHAGRPSVYVTQWENGTFYVGEAACVKKRLTQHRGKPGVRPSTLYRGPRTTMAYAVLPDTCAVPREAIEPELIRKLQRDGFPLSSDHDGGKNSAA